MSHEDGNSLNPGLKRKAQNDFNKDTTRFLFFDDKNTVLCSSFKVSFRPFLHLLALHASVQIRQNQMRHYRLLIHNWSWHR